MYSILQDIIFFALNEPKCISKQR